MLTLMFVVRVNRFDLFYHDILISIITALKITIKVCEHS
jgi:hypothetical protein